MNMYHPGENHSSWQDSQSLPLHQSLQQDIETEVCVIGGGIAGITTAYLLMKEGKKVCLLESFGLASGQTAKTTAQFTSALDERYFQIEKYFGLSGSRLAAQSQLAAIKKVEEIIAEENIDCDLERIDAYLMGVHADEDEILQNEWAAVQRAGLVDVEFLENSPLTSFENNPCLKFPHQMQLHPLKYLSVLCDRLSAGGVKIFTHTHVHRVQSGDIIEVYTKDGFTVRCKSVVMATNTPVNDLVAIHTKQAPYRSYVLGFEVPKGSFKKALYWDTLDPYHYLRLEIGEEDDLLLVGGEDHKTGQEDHPELRFENLKKWTQSRFPSLQNPIYKWSGQVMEPIDGLAFLGHNPMDRNNVYVITGTSGSGMTYGTIGAILVTDQIMGRKNPWEQLYNPSRKTLRAFGEFIKENANVVAQYGDWFTTETAPELEDLQNGEGKVIRQGLALIAAYKNNYGHLEYMSAACTHLDGVVCWNKAEKSWDCPCHGARYDCHGQVIEGPAVKDLQKLDIGAKTPLTLDLLVKPELSP